MNNAAISIKNRFWKVFGFTAIILFIGLDANAQFLRGQPTRAKLHAYIGAHKKEAVRQMFLFRIPASVILAQAIFESRCGTSTLARKSNNHFGIKCHREWFGDTTQVDDDIENECFRRYPKVSDSYTDHSLFLTQRARYAELFNLPITDYRGWCRGLKEAGYATYPTYAEELIRIIETSKLYELDATERLIPLDIGKKDPDLMASSLRSGFFSLEEFSRAGILWVDEKDVLIHSLDLIVDLPDEEGEAIAEIK